MSLDFHPLAQAQGFKLPVTRAKPPVTVLAHGCFDLMHLGHIRHLQEARTFGDKLVVSVTADDYVAKGVGRPYFTARQRAETLLALSCVDEVVVSNYPDATAAIRSIRPDVYVKGIDYRDRDDPGLEIERAAIEAMGGILVFTEASKFSSSRLINLERFPPETVAYLEHARANGFRDRILQAFETADKLSIAFVGETIIDEYRYVRGLGRASKELMLAVVETGSEAFDGGVVAASRHAEWKNVELATISQPIRKTRYVDADFNRKILDVYSRQRLDLRLKSREDLRRLFQGKLTTVLGCDVVIVFDFGHGLMDESARSMLDDTRAFTALNVQTNAGNYGYNLVTKYDKASFICVDDPEARLAVGMQEEPIDEVVGQLATTISCSNFLITHGKHGSIFRNHDGQCGVAPAFVAGGIDTMGAGDAVMAVTAPLIAAGLPVEMAALVGNVAGAIKTSIVGHRRHVGRQEIIQTVEALLA
jgi:rfaE bifunctional protein nucleotidyltransferase chain/domain